MVDKASMPIVTVVDHDIDIIGNEIIIFGGDMIGDGVKVCTAHLQRIGSISSGTSMRFS